VTKATAKPASNPARTSSNLSAGTKRRRGSGLESSNKRRRSSTTDLDSDSPAIPAKSTRAKKPTVPDTNPVDSDADGTGSSPYGTRSRGRGQARPNYAEDDGDFDYQPSKRTFNVGPGSRLKQESDTGKLSASTRRAAAAKSADTTAVSSATGSPAPSQPLPAVVGNAKGKRVSNSPEPPNAKKRKAANNPTASGTPVPAAPITRRAGQLTQHGTAHHELGILSFDHTKACLQNGALVSDDKVEFRVKGMSCRAVKLRR
jgi:hypothetical protein